MSVNVRQVAITPESFQGNSYGRIGFTSLKVHMAAIDSWNNERKYIAMVEGTPDRKGTIGLQKDFSGISCIILECCCSVSRAL